MRLHRYNESDADDWDMCCERSYMSTFIHRRKFLSYHGNRFSDTSIMIMQDDDILGVLPAAQDPVDPSVVMSHPGLTYGGILHDGILRGNRMVEAMEIICSYYADNGFSKFRYKAIPAMYHQAPAQDDVYALFRMNAKCYRCDLSSAINLNNRLKVSSRRQRGVKKAQKNVLDIQEGVEYSSAIWDVLCENLKRKHDAKPVHTLDEITDLYNRFPNEIKFIAGLFDGKVESGIVLFQSQNVWHVQYSATSQKGCDSGGLDALYESCIKSAAEKNIQFFNFGVSTEDMGYNLNVGLYEFKKEFGAGGVIHEFFEIDLEG